MKHVSILLLALTISNACFAFAPFSGRRDYKVGDKVVYSECVVRAQFDLGVTVANQQDAEKMTLACNNLATQVGANQTGVKISAELNGYSKTTVNCVACPVAQ